MNQLKKSMELNQKSRRWFIERWVEYMKTHSDKEWSRQQNILINSLVQNARNYPFDAKTYLKMKGEVCKRK